jgi:hypothetical protein
VTKYLVGSLFVALLLAAPKAASAAPFGFSCVTNNNATDCATLEAQLQLTVTAGAGNTVDFLFNNTGPLASSITDVYFDDTVPALLGTPGTITESAGVSFSANCSPGNLPGGDSIGFVTSYCADSDSPVQPMGVNPGEWLKISYTLQAGAVFDRVIDALNNSAYRVGVHVQGFSSGGSESAITGVPEPSSLLLLGTGLLTVVPGRFLKRRR